MQIAAGASAVARHEENAEICMGSLPANTNCTKPSSHQPFIRQSSLSECIGGDATCTDDAQQDAAVHVGKQQSSRGCDEGHAEIGQTAYNQQADGLLPEGAEADCVNVAAADSRMQAECASQQTYTFHDSVHKAFLPNLPQLAKSTQLPASLLCYNRKWAAEVMMLASASYRPLSIQLYCTTLHHGLLHTLMIPASSLQLANHLISSKPLAAEVLLEGLHMCCRWLLCLHLMKHSPQL